MPLISEGVMTQSAAQNWTQPTLGLATADLHCFLIVCALVSDLYCPGYNPKAVDRRLREKFAKLGVAINEDKSRIVDLKRERVLPSWVLSIGAY